MPDRLGLDDEGEGQGESAPVRVVVEGGGGELGEWTTIVVYVRIHGQAQLQLLDRLC